MNGLTAIDILVDPDKAAIERAKKVNARLLQSIPSPPGWLLDDTHLPHITTLQRYVRTKDLDQVLKAVEKTIAATDMASLSYQAVKITHADWGFPGYGPTVLMVEVSPEVLDFQAKLVDAITPFVESGGTDAAFVTDPGEAIEPTIIDWVDKFVPNHIRQESSGIASPCTAGTKLSGSCALSGCHPVLYGGDEEMIHKI